MDRIKRLKNTIVVISTLYVVLGIVLMARPETSTVTICRLFGAFALILGVIIVVAFFRRDPSGSLLRLDLVQGTSYAVLGAFMLFSPKAVVSLLHMILGIAIVFDSILRLQLAVNLKRLQYEQWWMYLVFTLITASLGTLLVLNPFEGSIILTRYVGVSLAINGVVNLWGIIYISRVFKN
jgi:uncharacterized membrane protein HdeD (DUF308 family)